MDQKELKFIIESLLFAGGEPIKILKLAKVVNQSREKVDVALNELRNEYISERRGFFIMRKEDEVQMGTNPDYVEFVNKLAKSDLQESLSQVALEVLSIIAYRGPIARTSIELIRGVNCSYTLRNLLMRGLIERVGNPADLRGYIYKISFDFLKKLGIDSVNNLPDYENLSKNEQVNNSVIVNDN